MRKIFFLFCMLCTPVFADSGFYAGVGVSVATGLNVNAGFYNKNHTHYFLQHFGARIDFAHTDPLKSAIDSVIDSVMRDGIDVGDGVKIYNGALDAWHTSVLLDYYPFAGNWRVSGGYAWGSMDLRADIFGEVRHAPNDRFYFYLAGDHYFYNGNDFGGDASIDWDFSGPYIGTGFDVDLFCGLSLFFDIGGVITNRPAKMSISIPHEQLYIYDTDTDMWMPITIPALDKDIARATRDANKKLSDLRFFPTVKVGFVYKF